MKPKAAELLFTPSIDGWATWGLYAGWHSEVTPSMRKRHTISSLLPQVVFFLLSLPQLVKVFLIETSKLWTNHMSRGVTFVSWSGIQVRFISAKIQGYCLDESPMRFFRGSANYYDLQLNLDLVLAFLLSFEHVSGLGLSPSLQSYFQVISVFAWFRSCMYNISDDFQAVSPHWNLWPDVCTQKVVTYQVCWHSSAYWGSRQRNVSS